jgi:hypothetical protein
MLEAKERMGALTEAEDQLLKHLRETSPEFFLLPTGEQEPCVHWLVKRGGVQHFALIGCFLSAASQSSKAMGA